MQIISGQAKRIKLTVPKGLEVRPTTARSREALFNSLGDFSQARVVDLFSGSGALGLEAASRGASEVLLVEEATKHIKAIEENISKVKKSGVLSKIQAIKRNVLAENYYSLLANPDVILADPPYPISAECFAALMSSSRFLAWASHALVVWELPEGGAESEFKVPLNTTSVIRKFGSSKFLLIDFYTED